MDSIVRCPFWPCGFVVALVVGVIAYFVGKISGRGASR